LRESTLTKTSAEVENNSPLYTEQTDTEDIIMSMHKQGLPAISIATSLQQRGIKSPKGNDRWSTSTINNILKKQQTGKIKLSDS
jgi:hypothetical protein